MPQRARFVPALTSLRFFAALWVVLYHAYENGHIPGGAALSHWLFGIGYQGVSFFFVLSGFVMAYNYDLGSAWSQQALRKFENARFARIYPAYALGLVLMAPLVLRDAQATGTPEAMVLAGLQLLFCLTLSQGWIPPFAMSWNAPGWSLSTEAFFYHLFPRFGPRLWKLAPDLKRTLLFALLVWCGGMLFNAIPVWMRIPGFGDRTAYTHDPSISPMLSYLFMLNPALRLGEFVLGILSCRAFFLLPRDHWAARDGGQRGSWIALGGVTAGLLLAPRIPFPLMFSGGVLAPFYSALIATLALGGSWMSRRLANQWMLRLGEYSYALYILHYPIARWMNPSGAGLPVDGGAWLAAYLAVCLAASALTYHLIEQPARRFLRGRFAPASREPAPLLQNAR